MIARHQLFSSGSRIRCIVQLWPGILQDVQSLESSFGTEGASLLISVQIVSGIHWLPVSSFQH